MGDRASDKFEEDEHRCGYDYDPWCDGCRTAYRDAGMEI